MKKLLAIFVALIMLVSLCSCTKVIESSKDKDDDEKKTEASTKNTDKSTDDDTASIELSDEESDNMGNAVERPLPDDSAAEETDPSDESVPFEFGQTSGKVYTNRSIGLKCTIPSDWRYYSDAELAELNNVVEGITDVDLSSNVYAMYAVAPDGNNVVVTVTESPLASSSNQQIKTYLSLGEDTLLSPLESMGLTIDDSAATDVTVDGKELAGYYINSSLSGLHMYQTLAMYVDNGYLINITATTLYSDTAADIFEFFEFI